MGRAYSMTEEGLDESPSHLSVAGRHAFAGVEFLQNPRSACTHRPTKFLLGAKTFPLLSFHRLAPRLLVSLFSFLLLLFAFAAALHAGIRTCWTVGTCVRCTKTMLRQRPGKLDEESSQDSPIDSSVVPPLDSDEQEKLVAMLARDTKRQTALFAVSERPWKMEGSSGEQTQTPYEYGMDNDPNKYLVFAPPAFFECLCRT